MVQKSHTLQQSLSHKLILGFVISMLVFVGHILLRSHVNNTQFLRLLIQDAWGIILP